MYLGDNKSRGGGYFDIPIPKVGQVDIRDVAYSTSQVCRFNGRTNPFFSVAQHMLETSMLCFREATDNPTRFNIDPVEAGLAGLLHDAPEYAYGDIISPVKKHMGEGYKLMAHEADNNIFEALGVTDLMERTKACWQWADLEMLMSDASRWQVFGHYVVGPITYHIEKHKVVPYPFTIRFADAIARGPGEMMQTYLDTYNNLMSLWKKPKGISQ